MFVTSYHTSLVTSYLSTVDKFPCSLEPPISRQKKYSINKHAVLSYFTFLNFYPPCISVTQPYAEVIFAYLPTTYMKLLCAVAVEPHRREDIEVIVDQALVATSYFSAESKYPFSFLPPKTYI